MRILVLDDQQEVCEDIALILRSFTFHDLHVFTASDEETAREILLRESIDIMLLDIVLLGTDAFSLIERISAYIQPQRIILMTGYPQIDYTLRAIKLQVAGFLLKPIEKEDLYDLLIQTMNRNCLSNNCDSSRYFYYSMLDAYLTKQGINVDFRNIAQNTGLSELDKDPFRAIVIINLPELNGFEKKFQSFVDSIEREKIHHVVYLRQSTQCILLVGLDKMERIHSITDLSGKYFPGYFSGASISDRQDGYQNSYSKAEFAYQCAKNLKVKNQTIIYQNMNVEKALIDQYSETLQSAMGNKDTLESILNSLFFELDSHNAEVHRVLESISSSCLESLPESFYEIPTLVGLQNKLFEYWSNESPNEISPKVQMILEFIRQHYRENISLTQAANLLDVGYTYASMLFKRQMHCGFVEYLTAFRLEKATNLLANTNYFVYEIAERVGIPNHAYFVQLFHKAYGMSPQAYRDSNDQSKYKRYLSEGKGDPHAT